MKRLKAILAAALAGCLLMAFTACTNGNNSTVDTNNASPQVNTSESADTNSQEESPASDVGEGSATEILKAFAEGEEGQSMISSMESASGGVCTGSLEVEGNTLVIICTYDMEIPEAGRETMVSALESALEAFDSVFQPAAEQLSQAAGEPIQFRVEYRDNQDEVLASRTFATADQTEA